MKNTLRYVLLLWAFGCFAGCGSDDTLSANEALQAIQRATWTTAVLNQAHAIVEPWADLSPEFSEEELQQVAALQFGSCAEIEDIGTAQDAHPRWRVRIPADCASDASVCPGSLSLQTRTGTSGPWVVLSDLSLECDQRPVQQGELRFRRTMYPGSEDNAVEIDMKGLTFTTDTNDVLAAENFSGRTHFRPEMIKSRDGHAFQGTMTVGEASFDDIGAQRTWAVEIKDLALYDGSATPRGGILRMRTVNENIYDFKSEWMPLTEFSTQVTIRDGREVWVGCISHDARDLCNSAHE